MNRMETSWREARNNGFSLHCCRDGQLNSPAAPLGVLENIWLASRTIEPGVVNSFCGPPNLRWIIPHCANHKRNVFASGCICT